MDSKVYLKMKYNGNKTICEDVFFTAPYKIMSPLYQGSEAEVVLMSSSAGLLKGDKVEMTFEILQNSHVKISSQSYEKIFHTGDGKVEKLVNILGEEGSIIKFMPYPSIPFEESNFENKVFVKLSETSKFCYSDIFSCGRVHMGEKFLLKRFSNYLCVHIEDIPVFIDNIVIEPSRWNYDELGLWHGYTHNGLLYLYGFDHMIETIREMGVEMLPGYEVGASLCKSGMCLRVLGSSGEKIYSFFQTVVNFITV